METVVGLLVAFAFLVAFAMFEDRHENTAEYFSQRGVTVNYPNRTVTIKNNTFDVSQIRRAWVDDKKVCFEVDDMANPFRQIKFSHNKMAQRFLSRFEIALSRANS